MIEVRDLKFRYRGSKKNTLNGVNFSVKTGECVAIVGQNGAGKSTLGRILAGLMRFRTGTVAFDDHLSTDLPIGVVFQNPENQIIFSNIRDELSFALKNLSPAELNTRIDDALAAVEMSDFKEQNLYELSLGQKQRIMIAEALAIGAKYLILDEPTTMIDGEGKQKIHEIIRRLSSHGHTIILFTNAPDELLLADRTLILEHGQIVAEIPRHDILKKSTLLAQHHIALPPILQLVKRLAEQGLQLSLTDFTIDEIASQIVKGREDA